MPDFWPRRPKADRGNAIKHRAYVSEGKYAKRNSTKNVELERDEINLNQGIPDAD